MTESTPAERAPHPTLGASGLVEHAQDVSAENTTHIFLQADDSDAESDKKSKRPRFHEPAAKDIDAIVTADKLPPQQDDELSPGKNGIDSSPPENVQPSQKQQKWQSHLLTFLNDQWFLLTMGFLIILASQIQVPQSQQARKSRLISYLCVCIIFFATGCTLDTSILIRNYARWKAHIWVQGQCFLLCSAITFGVVTATATNKELMDPGLLVGLVFMSCIPTTLATNVVMTGLAKGNQELTVVQVTLGNFIGVFITPALVIMYTSVPTWYNNILPGNENNTTDFPSVYRRVLKQLGISIYIPLFLGQITRYFFPNLCHKIFKQNPLFKRIPSLAMLVIIWSTYDQAFASGAFDTVPASNKIFLVFILLGVWLVYLSISVLASLALFPKKDVVAILYCVTGKGPATGIPLSISIFEGLDLVLESKLQIPVVIYQSLSIGFGTMIIPLLRQWIEKDEEKEKRKRNKGEV